ncbi:MAG: helix-turn-helix transcriptional regulator [Cetobacterium sp.]
MALSNANFRGVIGGKTLGDYTNKLDYNLKTLDERMECIKKVFNLVDIGGGNLHSDDEFWQEIWDMGVCKANLNTSDPLWSDTNVCQFLCRCADYLLEVYKPEDKEKQNIKVYKDKDLFKRALEEQDKLTNVAKVNQSEMLVFVNPNKNYKLAKDIAVTKEDINKHSEIKAYYDLKEYMLWLHRNPDERRKLAKRKGLQDRVLMRILNGNRRLLDGDMLDVKISKDRPIIWKSPLKDSGNEIDWDMLDMFDPTHVKPLLQVKKEIDITNDMLITLEELLKKVELTERQEEILYLWRKDMTQQYIADEMGVSRDVIFKQINKIVDKVIDEYEKEYEENYYYLNVVKGTYKKCSKCGEVKLIQRFNKNGKKGYRSSCKQCH